MSTSIVLSIVVSTVALGQNTVVIPPAVWGPLSNELSGDIAVDYLRELTRYNSSNGGSDDFKKETEWVASKARELGFNDVKILWMPSRERGWTVHSGELWLTGSGVDMKLGDVKETPLRVATNSSSAQLFADLVDVGSGVSEDDYSGREVKGKVVLASGSPDKVQEFAVARRGAIGILSYFGKESFPDQVSWVTISDRGPTGNGEFAWILTPREGKRVRAVLADAQRQNHTLRVRVTISSEFGPAVQGIVEGWIPGKESNNQDVVLTAHLQEGKPSANDDRSGCASLLEIGRSLITLIRDKKIRAPRRNIRFWWTTEIDSEYQYFADHPEEIKRILVDINQDMVGARQSNGDRVQYFGRTPYSRPSFLDDVLENAIEAVRLGNTKFPLWENPDGRYSRPLLSALGTQEPYHIEPVPYYGATDYEAFNYGRIGIPAVSFDNFPDPYMHSTADDLWQIDPTQLKRNAFVVAGSAYYIASVGDDDAPGLVSTLLSGAERRLARNSSASMLRLVDDPSSSLPQRCGDARLLLEETERRELLAIDSAHALLTSQSKSDRALTAAHMSIQRTAEAMLSALNDFYENNYGPLPSEAPSELERAATAEIPEWIVSLSDSIRHVPNAGDSYYGLSGLYVFEIQNLIDGHRSSLDIYRSVRAAALSAGDWYNGTVELSNVEELLHHAVGDGIIRIKRR
jgi:hypothetical protein